MNRTGLGKSAPFHHFPGSALFPPGGASVCCRFLRDLIPCLLLEQNNFGRIMVFPAEGDGSSYSFGSGTDRSLLLVVCSRPQIFEGGPPLVITHTWPA